jgi:branched-chain amino acid aminotransferase
MSLPRYAWRNGSLAPIEEAGPSIGSMSLHMGLAVFDGLMAYWNSERYRLHYARPHLERLHNGSARMGFPPPWSVEQLYAGIEDLLDAIPEADYYIRPTAYRGANHLWLTGIEEIPVDVSIMALPASRDVDAGLRCHISPVQRVSSQAIPVSWKVSGTYVNSYLSREAAAARGYHDGIMLDREGRICEASAANVFFVIAGKVVTPMLSPDVFPGVTRRIVIDLLKGLDVEVEELALYPCDDIAADAAFITSTLLEIRPIDELHGHEMASSRNEIFLKLRQRFRELTHSGETT